MFYAERAPAPTRALSPRQLPTDHVHAVSTREYQSDQSSRQFLGCHRPCCPNTRLKTHQRERVPATPPVQAAGQYQNGARQQGFASPRQTSARPCLLRAVPERPRGDGRLRREHSMVRQKEKPVRPLRGL